MEFDFENIKTPVYIPIIIENSLKVISDQDNSKKPKADFDDPETLFGEVQEAKTVNKAKNWCFTWFNYEIDEVNDFCRWLLDNASLFRMQEEVTPTTGQKHIQGCIILKVAERPSCFCKKWWDQKWNNIYWKATRHVKQSGIYCMKNDTRLEGGKRWWFPELTKEEKAGNFKSTKKEKPAKVKPKGVPLTDINLDLQCSIYGLYPWQQSVVNTLKEAPRDTKINWLYDLEGGIGKTEFLKWMDIHGGAITIEGCKSDNMAHAFVRKTVKKVKGEDFFLVDLNGKRLSIIIDYHRCTKHIGYAMIEQFKDGFITSAKYRSRTLDFSRPHVWVFCNLLPDFSKIAEYKCKIWCVNQNRELVPYEK